MNISIYTYHLGPGGSERIIANIANILSKKHNVTLKILYNIYEKPFYNINENVNLLFLTKNIVPNVNKIKLNITNRRFLSLFLELLLAIKIIFLKYYISIITIKNETSEIIISDRIFFSKLFSKFAPNTCIKISQEHNHHNGNKRYIKKVINSCKNIDYLMPASLELSDFYSQKLFQLKTKVKYIRHSLSYFPENKSSLTQKKIITVGRLVRGKGVDDLIDIFYKLTKVNSDWILYIVGDGVEFQNLKNKVLDLGISNKVIFTGNLKVEQLNKFYLSSSIYASCSWSESFGLTFLEAASFGVPSIAFDTAQGANEIIIQNETGYLVSDRNIDIYFEKLLTLVNDFDLRKTFGLKSKKYAKNFKDEKVKEDWDNFIKNLRGDIYEVR